MAKAQPSVGQKQWGTILNSHIAQLMDPATGGINTNAGNPTSLVAEDEGYTFIDTNSGKIKRFKGTGDGTNDIDWEIAGGGASVSSTEPTSPVEGQTWYDTTNNQMMVWDGANWVQVGGEEMVTEKLVEAADNADLDAAYHDKDGKKVTFTDDSICFKVITQQVVEGDQNGILKVLSDDGVTELATITKDKDTGVETVVYTTAGEEY